MRCFEGLADRRQPQRGLHAQQEARAAHPADNYDNLHGIRSSHVPAAVTQ